MAERTEEEDLSSDERHINNLFSNPRDFVEKDARKEGNRPTVCRPLIKHEVLRSHALELVGVLDPSCLW